MQMAAFQAGKAFTRAYVGYVHAIGHALGARYGTPHGFAMAVILPHVLELYGKAAHKRLSEMAVFTGIGNPADSEQENANRFIDAIRNLNTTMELPDTIETLVAEDIPELAKTALKEANPLYPVPAVFDKRKMEKAFYAILRYGETVVGVND
jgi:alcohol dehydrogenase class IV